VRLIVAATVLGCAGYGAYLMSGTASGPAVLTVVALVMAAAAVAQLLLPASGKAGHLTAVGFAGAAVLLLPAAASVSGVTGGLGPFDTPFESSATAHHNQALAAAAPALTRAVHRGPRRRGLEVRGTWPRLKACGNPDCRWAFYDRSHSRPGAWCDMATCGNRIKNRRLRQRQH